MNLGELLQRGEQLVRENNTLLLTAVGVTGTVTTAILTGRASFKAARIIRDENWALREETQDPAASLELKDEIRAVWPQYIPAVGVGTLTISSIVMANRLDSKRAAALAAAYSLSERAFTEYKEKVVEKLGEGKELAIRDEIAQDRVNANPVKEVIIAGSGDVLCMDAMTGRYFQSSIETIRKAQNTVNYDIINHMYASLSFFYEKIGLPPTAHSDEVGWNTNNLLELSLSTTFSSDERPCVVVDFVHGPIPDYAKLY
jgi:Family of unknown function (DUF6353)